VWRIKACYAALSKQFQGKIMVNLKCSVCVVLLTISTFLFLAACEPAQNLHHRENENSNLQEHFSFNQLAAIDQGTDNIEAVYGWLDSNTILYSKKAEMEEWPQLMAWNLKSNEHTILYQPSAPISSVSISPSKAYILVSTPLEEKIQSSILRANGELVYSVALPAYEITYEWNMYKDGVLFLSNFSKDWSYNSYIVNVNEQTIDMIDQLQPFAQWDSENGMMFLDWKKDQQTLTAPLVRKELDCEESESIMLDVVHFKKMKQTLMTIQPQTENLNRATYTFFDEQNKPITSFSVPYVNSYSDWKIPSYDFNEEKGDFFTFIPSKPMYSNQNEAVFTLITFNWKTGKKEKILQDIKSKSLSCSPDGNFCLYGYQLENIIDMQHKKVKPLFKLKQ